MTRPTGEATHEDLFRIFNKELKEKIKAWVIKNSSQGKEAYYVNAQELLTFLEEI